MVVTPLRRCDERQSRSPSRSTMTCTGPSQRPSSLSDDSAYSSEAERAAGPRAMKTIESTPAADRILGAQVVLVPAAPLMAPTGSRGGERKRRLPTV